MPLSSHRKLSPQKLVYISDDKRHSRIIQMRDRLSRIYELGNKRPLSRHERLEALALGRRMNRAKKNGWI